MEHLNLIDAAITTAVFVAAVWSFVTERIPPDLTAFLALLALLISGVLSPMEAFGGFSHPATVAVAAVVVLSAAIERTGALSFIARRVLEPLGRIEIVLTGALMLTIGSISAFLNNTAAVAVFIPVVLEVCRRTQASPGRLLMPMAHAATLGGMCTLIGTSTNLVAHEYAVSQGLAGFRMFELGQVALPCAVAGFVYMLFVGRWFLPKTQAAQVEDFRSGSAYVAELVIGMTSPWLGRAVDARLIARDHELELVELIRGGAALDLRTPKLRFEGGDRVLLRGKLDPILKLARTPGMDVHRPGSTLVPEGPPERDGDSHVIAEVVVLVNSGLLGRTIKESRFAETYDAVVLAIRRRENLWDRPSTTPLLPGDVLVVEAPRESLRRLSNRPGFVVIGALPPMEKLGRGVVLPLLVLAGVVAVAALGLAPIVTSATAGCALLMLAGRLKPREAYQAIDLSIVFMLAGSLALGAALTKTGIAVAFASLLGGLAPSMNPWYILAAFFFVSMTLSEFVSNSGTVALLGPVALAVAKSMGIQPTPLLVAVTFGASAAFAMPIGYQTSLMIYGPGGYKMRDFLALGLALDIIIAAVALWLIPQYWPLR